MTSAHATMKPEKPAIMLCVAKKMDESRLNAQMTTCTTRGLNEILYSCQTHIFSTSHFLLQGVQV